MNLLFTLISRYQKPIIGMGQLIFTGLFLIAFVIVIFLAFRKEKQITKIHFGNAGMFALAIGGGILLMILVKIFLRQAN
ncbi:MAG: hypothetical protein IT240_09095 [Bacteroidia bacterium]|nr:hypothetical protein [Bacteroidia bacterium]MCC6769186.1 hypothetical protein [Bacteroidia bacterium]